MKRKWKLKQWWAKVVYRFEELKNYRSNKKLRELLRAQGLLPSYEAESPPATHDGTPDPTFLAAVRNVLTSAGVGRSIVLVTIRAEYSDGESQTYTYPGPCQLVLEPGDRRTYGTIFRIVDLTPLPGTQVPVPVPADGTNAT